MKIVKVSDDGIEFDDGSTLVAHHEQDCCEQVYADFCVLKDQFIMDVEFDSVEIQKVEGSGFRLNKTFIPCYNKQNGYYSDRLELRLLLAGGDLQVIDISDCVEEHIF